MRDVVFDINLFRLNYLNLQKMKINTFDKCSVIGCHRNANGASKCPYHRTEKFKKDNPVLYYLTRIKNNNKDKVVTITVIGLTKFISQSKEFKNSDKDFYKFLKIYRIAFPKHRKRITLQIIKLKKR